MVPAYFTFTSGSPVGPTGGGDTYCDGSTCEARGMVVFGIPIEASDRRASGLLAFAENSDNFFYGDDDDYAIHTVTKSTRLANDGGAWSGAGTGARALGDDDWRAAESTVLTGEGGYEGLTLIMLQYWDDDSQMQWGVIVPTDRMPPMPDLIEPSAQPVPTDG